MKMPLQLLLATAPVLAVLFLCTPGQVLTTFIVLGQAHFFMSYWYQARAGKVNKSYLLRYAIGALVLLGFVVVTGFSYNITLVVANAIFAIHFLNDELFLLGMNPFTPAALCAVLPLFLPFTAILSDTLFHTQLVVYAIPLALFFACLYIFLRRTIDAGMWTVFLGLVFCAVILSGVQVSLNKFIGAFILLHGSRWYVYYGFKYFGTARLVPYLRDIALFNGVLIGLFMLYLYAPAAFLGFLFAPFYYFLWAILHIISSLRYRDYRGYLGYEK